MEKEEALFSRVTTKLYAWYKMLSQAYSVYFSRLHATVHLEEVGQRDRMGRLRCSTCLVN